MYGEEAQDIVLPKDIEIREANYEELVEVAEMVLTTFLGETNSHIPELEHPNEGSYKMFVQYYTNMAKLGMRHCVYIAFKDGKMIGLAGGHIKTHPWGTTPWGIEDYWFVLKEYRKDKVGILLFDKLIQWFEDNGAEKINMIHYDWNPTVKDFYLKKGFVPYERSYVKMIKKGE